MAKYNNKNSYPCDCCKDFLDKENKREELKAYMFFTGIFIGLPALCWLLSCISTQYDPCLYICESCRKIEYQQEGDRFVQ